MASEWTKHEYEVAMDQRDELFPGFGECSGDPETEETAEKMLVLLCQRNRALAALGADRDDFIDLYEYWNGGGEEAAIDACEHSKELAKKGLQRIDAAIAACGKGDAK